jgi:malonyl-CoA decarboxylase
MNDHSIVGLAQGAPQSMSRPWFDRLLSSLADRGRLLVRLPSETDPPLDRAKDLVRSLLSERGEASGAALARALLAAYAVLDETERLAFYTFLVEEFLPAAENLRKAAEAYFEAPGAATAMELAIAAQSPRRELLQRMNMAPKGTAMLVKLRADLLLHLPARPELQPLDADLKHLFESWFNRGFLELRRINWNTPAAILEKLIAYEAVHEIQGWEDLRRRLAPDRRCFAFFHPALDDEPLIFVEVALVDGIADAIDPLLKRGDVPEETGQPDTAIFYSISNCQVGLRGISFGNFLLKQVVEELKAELPSLERFSTLSPIPRFRAWLERRLANHADGLIREEDRAELTDILNLEEGESIAARLAQLDPGDDEIMAALKGPMLRLCALFLTTPGRSNRPDDPVARFHLGNGARLERINWLADTSPRGMRESCGMMVNYLYDLDTIEANHESFVRHGKIARSKAVAELARPPKSGLRNAGLRNAGLRSLARH